MPSDSSKLIPYLVAVLVVWRVYIRVRRNFGRQPIQPRRMTARAILLAVGAVLLAGVLIALHLPFAGFASGLVSGAVLAAVAARLTRFETTGEGRFYTPSTHIGIAISLLFVGRLAYRIAFFSSHRPPSSAPAGFLQSPFTLFVVGLTLSYYAAYYAWVLTRSRAEAETAGLAETHRF